MLRPFSSRRRSEPSSFSQTSWARRRCSDRSPAKMPFSSSSNRRLSSSWVRWATTALVTSRSEERSRSARCTSSQRACRRRRSSTARMQRSSRARSEISEARLALSTWRSRGLSWRETSFCTSRTRCRWLSMLSRRLSERSRRRLCLEMPAASSMRARRSSGLLARMESSLPWPMMECVSLPRPVSCRMSVMSSRRAGAPLIRYSLSPERYMRRVTTTSSKSTGST